MRFLIIIFSFITLISCNESNTNISENKKINDNLTRYNRFINSEIDDIDDLIKNVNEYEDFWKSLLPKVNFVELKRNLDSFNSVYKKGNLNKIPEDEILQKVLPTFPEKGGIRDLVLDMWIKAKGKPVNLLSERKEGNKKNNITKN